MLSPSLSQTEWLLEMFVLLILLFDDRTKHTSDACQKELNIDSFGVTNPMYSG